MAWSYVGFLLERVGRINYIHSLISISLRIYFILLYLKTKVFYIIFYYKLILMKSSDYYYKVFFHYQGGLEVLTGMHEHAHY